MFQALKKASFLCLDFLVSTLFIIYALCIYIPIIHILTFLEKPSKAVEIFIIGPLAGIGSFLLNPKSLIMSAVGLIMAYLLLPPAFPINYIMAVGLGLNLLTGFFESVIIRMKNSYELEAALSKDPNDGHWNYEVRKAIVVEKTKNDSDFSGLGPIANAVFFDFLTVNKLAKPGHRPYTMQDIFWMPEKIGGLRGR